VEMFVGVGASRSPGSFQRRRRKARALDSSSSTGDRRPSGAAAVPGGFGSNDEAWSRPSTSCSPTWTGSSPGARRGRHGRDQPGREILDGGPAEARPPFDRTVDIPLPNQKEAGGDSLAIHGRGKSPRAPDVDLAAVVPGERQGFSGADLRQPGQRSGDQRRAPTSALSCPPPDFAAAPRPAADRPAATRPTRCCPRKSTRSPSTRAGHALVAVLSEARRPGGQGHHPSPGVRRSE